MTGRSSPNRKLVEEAARRPRCAAPPDAGRRVRRRLQLPTVVGSGEAEHVSMAKLMSPLVANKKSPPLGTVKASSRGPSSSLACLTHAVALAVGGGSNGHAAEPAGASLSTGAWSATRPATRSMPPSRPVGAPACRGHRRSASAPTRQSSFRVGRARPRLAPNQGHVEPSRASSGGCSSSRCRWRSLVSAWMARVSSVLTRSSWASVA